MAQLNFFHHLANLPVSSLARNFFDTQIRLKLPGVVTNCKQTLCELNIGDPKSYTKNQWRKRIKVITCQKNKEDLINWMKNYKKIDYKTYEDKRFEMSSYFKNLNIEDARMMLKIKLKMVPTIRSHFKSNKKFKADKYQCPDYRMES